MDYSKNEIALLDLIKDINETFSFVGQDQDEPLICDGDIRLLDKAVKRFKTTVWENQLTQWHNKVPKFTPRDYNTIIQTFIPFMKKVSLSFILDNLTELGWDYTCGRMSRSGMEIYDGIMRHVGVLGDTEHWNEDVYSDSNGNW